MKVIVILSLILVSALCAQKLNTKEAKDLFKQWKLTHKKVYRPAEEIRRFRIFTQNYLKVLNFNAKKTGVTLALNQFADLTTEEFTKKHTGFVPQKGGNNAPVAPIKTNVPNSVDWRTKGAVTPVKNQLACGSCWAFSAVGALEGLYFIQKGELVSFSEQLYVDCSTKDYGCNGGWMSHVFEYTAEKGGERSTDYPYVARNQQCKYDAGKSVRINSGYVNITAKSASALKSAISINPVSVAIQANQAVFQLYRSGVIKTGCGSSLNHGVLAVGYDTFNGDEAFIVKNSWGTLWGNQGYVLIGTDESINNGYGVCGILSVNNYPTA